MSIFDIFAKIAKQNEMSLSPVTHIICGLGNPGSDYENTRHNAGFMAVDELAKKYNVNVKKLKFKSLTAEITIGGKKTLLMKPSTYMNKSGEAVVEAMNFYKIPPENVIILYDDISFDVGVIRVRQKGSDGGHNGMKNIIMLTGKDTFPRVKIGVGAKPHKDYNLADWVLSPFKINEAPELEKSLQNAATEAEKLINAE